MRDLLRDYETDVEPPFNTTVSFGLGVLCATPLSDFISMETWLRMVSTSGGSRKKYLGGLAPHHLGGNNG